MITAADLRAARAWLDETQEQFAKRFGIERSTLAGWEKTAPTHGPAALLIERVFADLGLAQSLLERP